MKPMDIEKKSFEIIENELNGKVLEKKHEKIIKRVIHTTADFDYVDNLCFSDGIVDKILNGIKESITIVTDTNMVKAGVNKKILEKFSSNIVCFMADEDVAVEAKKREVTRATVSMERASKIEGNVLFAIGNAPTALIKIEEMYKENKINPLGVIACPVGFVNVIESKEGIINSNIGSITARGRKGGSNVAAAICNALLYMASNDERE